VSPNMFKERVAGRLTGVWRCLWAALALQAALCSFGQTGGISTEGPLTVFRGDSNDFLLTLTLPFDAPGTNAQPRLDFIFGFATDEPASNGVIADSFSATLQDSNQASTALLFTADRSGVDWAPENPGGLTISVTNLSASATNFPNLNPSLDISYAYIVSFLLPPELTA